MFVPYLIELLSPKLVSQNMIEVDIYVFATQLTSFHPALSPLLDNLFQITLDSGMAIGPNLG